MPHRSQRADSRLAARTAGTPSPSGSAPRDEKEMHRLHLRRPNCGTIEPVMKKPAAPDPPKSSQGLRAEIRRLNELEARLMAEAVELFKSHGFAPPPPENSFDAAVRAHVIALETGQAPSVPNARARSRDEEIEIHRTALRQHVRNLQQELDSALDREAWEWANAHADEWRECVRNIVLLSARLYAYEERAREMAQRVHGRSARLALGEFIGSDYSIIG